MKKVDCHPLPLDTKLANKLKKKSNSLVNKYIPSKGKEYKWPPTVAEIKTYGVAGNTFRAYTGMKPYKPSVLYRQWARATVEKLIRENKLKEYVCTEKSFEKWHKKLAQSLEQSWHKNTEGKVSLSVAQKYKLVDLFVKWLSRFNFGDQIISDGLIQNAHAALDSKILGKMNQLCQGNLHKPKNVSMSFIKEQKNYICYQNALRYICNQLGSTPLIFDYYAWNEAE